MTSAVSIQLPDVRAAAERIAPHAHRTPVMTSTAIDALAGRSIFFKCENFQKVGAFKFRGACNFIMQLPDEVAARGVATHSSGNHAQAVALAARLRGIDAHIVMPENSVAIKRRAVESYGGRVTPCAPTLAARDEVCSEVIARTGATFVPPYDHPDIIAGQGTAALELLDETGALDAIIAPVGGGGLLSGTAIAARGLYPDARVFAGEPEGADDAARSMAAGKLIPQTDPRTVCDGLRTSLGELTWPIIHDHVERIITVPDDVTIDAMRLVWERMKIIIEPSCAVALAAVMSDEFRRLEGIDRVGLIISGGNVDLDALPWK